VFKNRVNQAKRVIHVGNTGNDDRLTAVAASLEWVRPASDDVLGAAVVRHGSCMDVLPDGDRPGWLFDDQTDSTVAARVCAGCPVRDECLELELRLFGAQQLGMWGGLGEDERRALHPVWARLREHVADGTGLDGADVDTADVDGAGRGGDR
jgi:WhiB family redox-sensing transcriptional regulator